VFEKKLVEPKRLRFVCDRGVTHEIVRHRLASYCQESTRYCNYSNEQFGAEITVIEPCFLVGDYEAYSLWKRESMDTETGYRTMRNMKHPAQECRGLLNLTTKTELVMTGNLRAWNHFFNLRARQITGPAHPQAVELAVPLMHEMARRFPDVIMT